MRFHFGGLFGGAGCGLVSRGVPSSHSLTLSLSHSLTLSLSHSLILPHSSLTAKAYSNTKPEQERFEAASRAAADKLDHALTSAEARPTPSTVLIA